MTAPTKKYRDDDKRLKRQAAGFWVYAYDDANPSSPPVLVEVGPGKPVTAIEWTVHLANSKAAWFKFDGLTGSGDILNPPLFGYPAGSFRNPSPPLTDVDGRRKQWVIDPGPRTLSTRRESLSFAKAAAADSGKPGRRLSATAVHPESRCWD